MTPPLPDPVPGEAPLLGFRRDLRAEVVAGEATYLFSEHGVTAMEAAALESLAPLLDGTRDAAALLRDAAAHTDLTPTQVAELTRQLAEAGVLSVRPAGPAAVAPEALAYWEAAGLDSAAAASLLASATVSVRAVGGVDPEPVRSACAAAGLRTGEPGSATLDVVLCGDYLDPELAEVDRVARASGRPWLLARPTGTRLWIGPLFDPRPGAAGCWRCLAHRVRLHRRAEQHVQSALGRSGPAARPVVALTPVTAAAGQLVVLEAVKWLAGHRYDGQRAVWTLDTLTLQGRHHEVTRRPQCGSCGDPAVIGAATLRPVELVSRRKASTEGGGHRSMTPEQTLDRYRHLVSPVTGVVREIRRDERGPEFLNSFHAGANLALPTGGAYEGLRSQHGGKGVTAAQAECSALCEALERHSGSFHGDELRIPARYSELGPDAVHPDTIQLFDPRQYETRAAWNAGVNPLNQVPVPYDDNGVHDWTPVWSLTGQRQRLVPTGLLYYGAPAVAGLRPDSNGNAAGSSLEDAVLQGFLELVERDAVALWWYNRTRQPGIDLDAYGDPWIGELRQVHAGLHREVWALDLTADLGIPTVVALSRRTDKPAQDVVFGFGAHFDPRVALRRALTELNQLLPAVVDADADGHGYAVAEPDALRWWLGATVQNQPYLLPDGAATPRPYEPREDLRADIAEAERLVAGAGMELLVLDQTRPDIGLPVVKVIVPGLRHFWTRFAPGRLYDVPVALGRVAEPTPYDQLNPLPIFV